MKKRLVQIDARVVNALNFVVQAAARVVQVVARAGDGVNWVVFAVKWVVGTWFRGVNRWIWEEEGGGKWRNGSGTLLGGDVL